MKNYSLSFINRFQDYAKSLEKKIALTPQQQKIIRVALFAFGCLIFFYYPYNGYGKKDSWIESRITFINGKIHKGLFKNGFLIEGKIKLIDGSVFKGTVQNDRPLIGRVTFSNGEIHEGIFNNCKLVEGIVIFANGETQTGLFKNNYLESGTVIKTDRKITTVGNYNSYQAIVSWLRVKLFLQMAKLRWLYLKIIT